MPFALEGGRHADVGDEHLRRGGRGPGDQLVVVARGPDDLEVGLDREQRAHALAHDHVVVGEEDRDATGLRRLEPIRLHSVTRAARPPGGRRPPAGGAGILRAPAGSGRGRPRPQLSTSSGTVGGTIVKYGHLGADPRAVEDQAQVLAGGCLRTRGVRSGSCRRGRRRRSRSVVRARRTTKCDLVRAVDQREERVGVTVCVGRTLVLPSACRGRRTADPRAGGPGREPGTARCTFGDGDEPAVGEADLLADDVGDRVRRQVGVRRGVDVDERRRRSSA